MISTGITSDIQETNLSYLLLAQRLLQENKALAIYTLGLSEQVGDVLSSLTLAQLLKLSRSSQLLLRFRFEDHTIFASLADKGKNVTPEQEQSAIGAADRSAETI